MAENGLESYQEAASDLLENYSAEDLAALLIKQIAKDDASEVPVNITPERPLPSRGGKRGGGNRGGNRGGGNRGGNRGGGRGGNRDNRGGNREDNRKRDNYKKITVTITTNQVKIVSVTTITLTATKINHVALQFVITQNNF